MTIINSSPGARGKQPAREGAKKGSADLRSWGAPLAASKRAAELGLADPKKVADDVSLLRNLESEGLLVLTPPQDPTPTFERSLTSFTFTLRRLLG